MQYLKFLLLIGLASCLISCSQNSVENPVPKEYSLSKADALTVELMKASGFKLINENGDGIIFLPNPDGSYKVIGRFDESFSSNFCEYFEHHLPRTGELRYKTTKCLNEKFVPNPEFEVSLLANRDLPTELEDDEIAFELNLYHRGYKSGLPTSERVPPKDILITKRTWQSLFDLGSYSDPFIFKLIFIDKDLNRRYLQNKFDVYERCFSVLAHSTFPLPEFERVDCRNSKSKQSELEVEEAKRAAEEVKKFADKAEREFECGLGIQESCD